MSSEGRRSVRRYDNDWLTVLAMLAIFLFHCARFFDYQDWHVKNVQLDAGMSLFVGFLSQWIMPLFFVLSGVSSFYSLRSRSGSAYLGNRFRRLVVPFLLGTFVVLIPLQVWMERVSHGQYEGSFLAFYPRYFEGFYAFGGNFAWMGLHLWYLEMLFVFTLLTLPLFRYLQSERVHAAVAGAAAFFGRGGAIFLFGSLVFAAELLVNLQPDGVGRRDFGGWSPVSYLVYLVIGFIVATDPRYREAMEKRRFLALGLGLLTSSLMFVFTVDLAPLGGAAAYAIQILFRAFNAWFWLVAVLGFGSRHLDFANGALRYGRQAALPFYVLHQTVIVAFGFYLAGWETTVIAKYALLAALSFATIVALYELLIRRIGVLRFLFGMKGRAG